LPDGRRRSRSNTASPFLSQATASPSIRHERTLRWSAALLALPSFAVSPGALALFSRRAIPEVRAKRGIGRTRRGLAHIPTGVVIRSPGSGGVAPALPAAIAVDNRSKRAAEVAHIIASVALLDHEVVAR